ncbi:hypothetical protein FLJU110815_06425 [Flavobacterium jumunjinense]
MINITSSTTNKMPLCAKVFGFKSSLTICKKKYNYTLIFILKPTSLRFYWICKTGMELIYCVLLLSKIAYYFY